MTTTNTYRTTDTALASYLITIGSKLQSIDYTNPRYQFIFPMSPEIDEHAQKYILGQARIDPAIFNRINRKLLRIVRQQIQWEDD